MDVVAGIRGLRTEHGPVFAVVGVFDGLHLGHQYLLEHLVAEADRRAARPTVITFDHHPDEVLLGSAPPLLLHPDERLERLAAAGVAVIVVQHFDETVRRTTYDAFIAAIRERTALAGLLMTPDAAFGFERRGTPEAVTELAKQNGFDVVVVPPFTLRGRSVRSSDVRTAIAAGDLRAAAELLGRAVALRGVVDGEGSLGFFWPMALPPDGRYPCEVGGATGTLVLDGGRARLDGVDLGAGSAEITLLARR
jgi:riboflavin kinase/FMN adenylyltransferase